MIFLPFLTRSSKIEPETNNPIKMEVGIEECLHIEFEYNKVKIFFIFVSEYSFSPSCSQNTICVMW